MSYSQLKEYKIVPTQTYKIIRNCSGCGCKNVYLNTNKFRINANGKLIDVWLIYQCEKCKHTYNLPVYSRISKTALDKSEYQALQQSDEYMVMRYGLNRNLFKKNNAKIYAEPPYVLEYIGACDGDNAIRFINPYHISIRNDKLLADCLEISRSKAKRLLDTGVLLVEKLTDDEIVFRYTNDTCITVSQDKDSPVSL